MSSMATPVYGIHNPALQVFPKILNEPFLLKQLLRNKKRIGNLSRKIRKSMAEAAQDFTAACLALWPLVSTHGVSADGTTLTTEQMSVLNSNTSGVDKPFLVSDESTNADAAGCNGLFTPFSISEVATASPDTACAWSTLEQMIHATTTGKAKKVKRGGGGYD